MELMHRDVAVLTFTRRRWWPACALSPMARPRPKCGPSRRPRRTFDVVEVAGGKRVHACGDESNWRLLEAGLAYLG